MPDESYYKERGEEKKWPKIVLLILGVAVLALIILLIVKGCTSNNNIKNNERDLLEAGKEYYRIEETSLPQAPGECKSVTLDTLLNENLITTPDNYANCNKDKTYVKVCKLESGSYHYLPIMQCGSTLADDNFTDWQEGTESDLVVDKSDVRFTFKGERLEVSEESLEEKKEAWLDELKGIEYKTISSTKYYRYRDLTWKWETNSKEFYGTNAYYADTPGSGYTNHEGKTTGWKWYTETYKREWKEIGKPETATAKVLKYYCIDDANKPNPLVIESDINCSKREDKYKITTKVSATCDGVTPLPEGASMICTNVCKTGVLSEDKNSCGNMEQTVVKKYYPSGSSDASKENTYYVSAPTSGAKKDESSAKQVARYYKLNKTTSGYLASAPSSVATKVGDPVWGAWSSYQTTQPKAYSGTRQIETRTKVVYQKINENINLDNWIAISDDYLSETDLINKFKSLEYDVNTLEDIDKAEDLRYQIKLEYRDRK